MLALAQNMTTSSEDPSTHSHCGQFRDVYQPTTRLQTGGGNHKVSRKTPEQGENIHTSAAGIKTLTLQVWSKYVHHRKVFYCITCKPHVFIFVDIKAADTTQSSCLVAIPINQFYCNSRYGTRIAGSVFAFGTQMRKTSCCREPKTSTLSPVQLSLTALEPEPLSDSTVFLIADITRRTLWCPSPHNDFGTLIICFAVSLQLPYGERSRVVCVSLRSLCSSSALIWLSSSHQSRAYAL